MLRRRIGRTALEVTELGFGSAGIGNLYQAVPTDIALATVDAAWDEGIRYFDTAPHYGLGLAERRLGAGLAARPRDEFVVSTKVGRLITPHDDPTGSDLASGGFDVPDHHTRTWDLSADGVRRSLDASLERLDLDRIDIVLVHDPDQYPGRGVDQVIRETLPALLDWRDQGIVGAVGVGMNQWQDPLRIVQESDLDVVMLAGRWTLLDRSGEPLLDACADRGVSVLAAAPYNSGLLASDTVDPEARFDYRAPSPAVLAHRERLATVAAARRISLPALAIRFPLLRTATTSVVVGLRSPDEAHAAAQRYSMSITGPDWAAVLKAGTPPA